MTENLHRANNFILLAGGAALIGFAPIFVRWSEMSPSWILFYRMLLTLPMLLLINLYLNKSLIFKVRSNKTISIAYCSFCIYNRFNFMALEYDDDLNLQLNNYR